MGKKKAYDIDDKLLEYIKSVKSPLLDKRHNITIYLDDNRARSNQSRFEHIVRKDHRLSINDLKRLFSEYNCTSKFRKDKKHKHTYCYYVKRNHSSNEYIKMCIYIDDEAKRIAKVKTIFITRNLK